jgi:NADH dehydrogenase FAD-containing subunit
MSAAAVGAERASKRSLEVLIVGAGFGGVAAAIACSPTRARRGGRARCCHGLRT